MHSIVYRESIPAWGHLIKSLFQGRVLKIITEYIKKYNTPMIKYNIVQVLLAMVYLTNK